MSVAGSFAPAGATGAFAPVGDELLENVDPDDIYVDDADDSAYEENYTETGAFTGPGYVEMPKSRMRRLLDRFRRKKDEAESTPQEWLDVDESFDARTVGAERGGWESFREDATTQMDFQDGFADGSPMSMRRAVLTLSTRNMTTMVDMMSVASTTHMANTIATDTTAASKTPRRDIVHGMEAHSLRGVWSEPSLIPSA